MALKAFGQAIAKLGLKAPWQVQYRGCLAAQWIRESFCSTDFRPRAENIFAYCTMLTHHLSFVLSFAILLVFVASFSQQGGGGYLSVQKLPLPSILVFDISASILRSRDQQLTWNTKKPFLWLDLHLPCASPPRRELPCHCHC